MEVHLHTSASTLPPPRLLSHSASVHSCWLARFGPDSPRMYSCKQWHTVRAGHWLAWDNRKRGRALNQGRASHAAWMWWADSRMR